MSKTTVFQARAGSKSMKGAIPKDVVSALHLKHKDRIEWSIEIKDAKIVAVVTRI
ncbi:MAG: hypothetical protein M1503_00535 [Thaumarchaeota archaeon]|nr:hypothetical protein [Nitrososphaerota archaeon]